jgi:cyclophilin family peptidyl-prolyl cis-trans isomerase
LAARVKQVWWKVQNEMLELCAALGNIVTAMSRDNRAKMGGNSTDWLLSPGFAEVATYDGAPHAEFQVALARINPGAYLDAVTKSLSRTPQHRFYPFRKWRAIAAIAQGLSTLVALKPEAYGNDLSKVQAGAQERLKALVADPRVPVLAIPDVMRAYLRSSKSPPQDLLRSRLQHEDVIVRATAAELLGEQPPGDANTRALAGALPRALKDRDLNDAALAILDALGKQKANEANDAIKTALKSDDHLIRRKAVALLKANGAGDFSDRIGLVKTRYTDVDYRRAMARVGKKPTATIVTSKGSFTIEFLPADATLNVDNFIQLAKRGYFNGQTIPRVVPNFVVQAGDPRGDQNGGPGYQIRCEINEVPYERAAVGMALSGKDTGGSQWFVTHSPQPHLDGGYTVFGRVIRGMEVIDNIARGDVIRRVIVNER